MGNRLEVQEPITEKVVPINKYNMNKNLDKISLISPFGFGDTLILCGFKNAIEKQYDARIHFIIKPEHVVIMHLYGITDYSFENFDKDTLEKISKGNSEIKIGKVFVAHPKYLNDDEKLLQLFIDYKISMIDLFRMTLKLPEEAHFEAPTNIPQISLSLQNKLNRIAPLDKIVLFSPESFSTKRINRFYLEDMVKDLKEEGYVIVSSVLDKDEAIKGSTYIELSFEDALAVGMNCAKVYAVRSGFVDVLLQYRQNFNVIYPDIDTYKCYSVKQYCDEITEIFAPRAATKKIGPFFQIEDKGNEQLFRFCLTFLRRKKKERNTIKYCILGIPVLITKKQFDFKKYYLFGCLCVFRRRI